MQIKILYIFLYILPQGSTNTPLSKKVFWQLFHGSGFKGLKCSDVSTTVPLLSCGLCSTHLGCNA